MTRTPPNWVASYCGILLTLSLLIGGGTVQGLWTDYIIMLACTPLIYLAASYFRPSLLGWFETALIAGIVVFLGVQFLPRTLDLPDGMPIDSIRTFLSLSPQRAFEAALWMIPMLAVFLIVQRLSQIQQKGLLPFVYFGLAINLALSVLQLSAGSTLILAVPLPYDTLGGLFANPNHFSALVYLTVPILGWHLLPEKERYGLFLLAAAVLALINFAVGSAAAMFLTLFLTLACLMALRKKSRTRLLVGFLVILIALAAAVVLILLRDPEALGSSGRIYMAKTTWRGVTDQFPWGSGLGSFIDLYPRYDQAADVSPFFTSHAHNDYVELLLEGGILTASLMAAYGVLLLSKLPRDVFKRAAFLGVIALLIHSAVDYPLRTTGIAMVFAVFNGIIFHRPARKAT